MLNYWFHIGGIAPATVIGQPQADLPPAGQFDIKLGQQFRVEQRSVLHPVAAVDAVARAQGIKRQFGTGMFRFGDCQRVYHAKPRYRFITAQDQFGVEKIEIELGIMRDQI